EFLMAATNQSLILCDKRAAHGERKGNEWLATIGITGSTGSIALIAVHGAIWRSRACYDLGSSNISGILFLKSPCADAKRATTFMVTTIRSISISRLAVGCSS